MLQIVILVVPFAILIGIVAWSIRRYPSPYSARRDPFRAAKRGWRIAAVAVWGVGMLSITSNVSFVCMLAGFIVFGVMQRQQQRVDERRYSRPRLM